jgi:hypothetical protein
MPIAILLNTLLSILFIPALKAEKLPLPAEGTNIVFHWEDDFSKSEKNKVIIWLNATSQATFNLLGNYPFELHYHLYREADAREPVPWANTIRTDEQGVNFYINPDFTLADFLHDWTAPHELSHLAIPAVGPENSWFAEGFASFLQGSILVEMNEFSQEEIDEKYQKKRAMAKPYFNSNKSFTKIASHLKRNHHYAEFYWGGAGFFAKLDEHLLKTKGINFTDILKTYESCCRLRDQDLEEIVSSFDKISGDRFSTELLYDYRNRKAREVF